MMLTTPSAQRTYRMLGHESLWELTARVHALLEQRNIDHAIIGGVAVCLHGYQRDDCGLDLLVRAKDLTEVRTALEADGFQWVDSSRDFLSWCMTPVRLFFAGESAGPGQSVAFPDPGDPNCLEQIEGLPVLSLSELIQAKLACGLGDPRRTHKDFADVVELIAIHRLDGSFARFLHKSVQAEFRALVHRVFPNPSP